MVITKQQMDILYIGHPLHGPAAPSCVKTLSGLGEFDIKTADSLSSALKHLAELVFHTILIDLDITENKKTDFFKHIRKYAENVPIILLVSASDEHPAWELVRNGVHDCISREETNNHLLPAAVMLAVERCKSKQPIVSFWELSSIYQNSSEGIMVVDDNGIVKYVNTAVENFLGSTAKQIIGSRFEFPVHLEKCTEIDIIRNKKKRGIAEMRASDVFWQNKPARLILLRDVTELKQWAEDIRQAKETAETANREKSEFLANMSHELRSPLNSILLLSRLLLENRKGHLTEEQIEFAEVIHNSGNDLMILINNILDYSKLEAGKASIYIGEMRFDELSDHIKQTYFHFAANNGIELKINISELLPDFIWTDYQKLIQILRNLISNAIKFTSKGCLTVDIHRPSAGMEPAGDTMNHGNTVAFSVIDTGIGIPADKQSDIFDAFKQADGSTSRFYGGTGLGLSISRKLAELLGGEIHLTSVEGEGSTFTLYIPEKQKESENVKINRRSLDRICEEVFLTQADKLKDAADFFDAIDETLKGGKILIVDDDVRNLFIMTKLLEEWGMHIVKAVNGKKALDILENRPDIDLVLMDIMMPEMDGYETIRKIRAIKKNKDLPVIALTAKAMEGDRQKGFAAGADDYISKPIDIKKLRLVMHKLFERVK